MENYHRRGEPVMEAVLRQYRPKFLLANHRALFGVSTEIVTDDDRYRSLLPADVETITRNFVHHWGPIRVAGRYIEITEANRPQVFELLIEGPYTVEFPEPVMLNGTRILPGESVHIGPGSHTLKSATTGIVTLRWGDRLARPDIEPPQEWLWDGL